MPGVSATSRFPFARLMTASGLSNLADGVLKTAVPLVALRYTTSPAQIAGLSFAMTLPWLVAALPAGALVDRWDRRRTMLVANTIRAGNDFAVDDISLSTQSIVNPLNPVPEPATWALMIVGFGMVGGAVRSSKRRSHSVAYA